jgi:hypothetical protein
MSKEVRQGDLPYTMLPFGNVSDRKEIIFHRSFNERHPLKHYL